jgi:hypothetical protein
MKPFRTHDLRRSGATLLGFDRISNTDIGRCLDHQDGEGPSTTGIYNQACMAAELKRPTLERLDALLREAIGEAPAVVPFKQAA